MSGVQAGVSDAQERFLLNSLAAIQSGDKDRIHSVCKVLFNAKDLEPNAGPILIAVAKLNDEDLRIHALARLPQFPKLIEQNADFLHSLIKGGGMVAGAAACALSFGDGPQSVSKLKSVLSDSAISTEALEQIVGPLSKNQEVGCQLLVELESLESRLNQSESGGRVEFLLYSLSETINKLYLHVKYENQKLLQAVDTEIAIPLPGYTHDPKHMNDVLAEHRRDLPELKVGILVDEHIRFLASADSRCRLTVSLGQSGRFIVIFTQDEESFGTSQTFAIESLATAVSKIYDLNPRNVLVIDNWLRTSGLKPMTTQVQMKCNDTGFRDPKWTQISNLAEFMKNEGVEIKGLRLE